jgi:hypothetical protein
LEDSKIAATVVALSAPGILKQFRQEFVPATLTARGVMAFISTFSGIEKQQT